MSDLAAPPDAGQRIAQLLAIPPADLSEAETYILAVLGQVWAKLDAIEDRIVNAERVITETATAVTSGGGLLGKLLGGGKGPGTAAPADLAGLAGMVGG